MLLSSNPREEKSHDSRWGLQRGMTAAWACADGNGEEFIVLSKWLKASLTI